MVKIKLIKSSGMTFKKAIKRELEVAFSKYSQPVWFRVVKYIALGCLLYFFWSSRLLWIILSAISVFGMILHFWYRFKTNGWTKSYGLWKYHESAIDKGKE
jgi:hypothetical protein